MQKKHAKEEKFRELLSIASLKERQIIQWRSERIADGLFFYSNPFFRDLVGKYSSQKSSVMLKDIRNWLLPLYNNHDYLNIILFDATGRELLRMNQKDSSLNDSDILRIVNTSKNEEVTLSNLIRDEISNTIFMDNVVPLLIERNGKQIKVGILLFRIDPEMILFPLIQTWPVQTKTAETILLRFVNDSLLVLNELRHKKETALQFIVKTDDPMSIFNQNILSVKGVIEGKDYRNEEVLAGISSIDGTPWYIISKIDITESYAIVQQNGIYLVIITGLLILVISSGFFLYIKNQQSIYFREKYNLESEKKALIQHYGYLHKYANDIIILSDYNGNIIDVNDKAVSTYLYSQEEFLKFTLTDLRSPNAHAEPIIKQVMNSEAGLIFETIHKKKDGTTFYVELSSRLILIEGVHYIQAIIRDVTERKEAEKQLFNVNNYLTTLIDSSPIAIYDIDGEGRIKSIWNKSAEKIFGWKKEELLGKRLPSIEADNWSEFEKLKVHVQTGEVISNIEVERIRKNGEKFFISLFVAPIFNETKQVVGAISMASDITKKREAEKALSESEKKYRDIFQNSPNAMWVCDFENNNFLEVNNAAIERYGYTKDEFLKMKFDDIIIGRVDEQSHIREDNKILQKHRTKSNESLNVEVYTHSIDYEGKNAQLALVHDVTIQKQTEAQLRTLTLELEERVKERTLLLEEANKELESFSYSISHDLRAPLRHINSFLELAKLKLPADMTSETLNYINIVSEAANRMSMMIDELLDFSRKNKSEIVKSEFSMNEVVEKVLLEMKPDLQNKNIQFEIAQLPIVFADYKMIKTLTYNLIENAVKFSSKKETPKIVIGTREEDKNEHLIFIADNGVGFNPIYKDKLFGVFKRLHKAEEFEGIGIGLANVQRIITRHGGRVWAESKLGEGATFYFTLPIINKVI
jgi:PAS domain S-box-containing protein